MKSCIQLSHGNIGFTLALFPNSVNKANMKSLFKFGVLAAIGPSIVLTIAPSYLFGRSFVRHIVDVARRSWPPFESAYTNIEQHFAGYADQFIFSYIVISLMVLLVTMICSAYAFSSSRNGSVVVKVADGNLVPLALSVSMVFLFLLQIFWIDKFTIGKSNFPLIVAAAIWFGFYQSSVMLFTWLGRNLPR